MILTTTHVDSRIRETQYGFRKNRSATQPIHVMRRLIEIFERQNTPFHAFFWIGVRPPWNMRAFPPILERLLCRFIIIRPSWSETPPRNPPDTHKLKDYDTAVLSPYLFGLVLTHLFFDVEPNP